ILQCTRQAARHYPGCRLVRRLDCAALVAQNADFVKVRKFIAQHGNQRLRQMRRWCTTPSEDQMMQACKDAVALYRAMRGHSLLNTGVLRN
ncbi:hypothetical protein ABTD06_19025, partial [Acinetobacter baumannii]